MLIGMRCAKRMSCGTVALLAHTAAAAAAAVCAAAVAALASLLAKACHCRNPESWRRPPDTMLARSPGSCPVTLDRLIGASLEIASSAHGCEFASAAQRVGGGETVRGVRVTCFSSIFEEAGHTDGHTLPCPPKGRAPVRSSPGVLCPVLLIGTVCTQLAQVMLSGGRDNGGSHVKYNPRFRV